MKLESFMLCVGNKLKKLEKAKLTLPFHLIDGRKYQGPNIIESEFINKEEDQKISKEQRFRTPVFIDCNGTCYGHDYIPLANYQPDMQQAIENGLFIPNADVYKDFPDPKNYESYSEYNQSLSEWYSKMQNSLGKIKLPNITGRRYCRPRLDLFEDQSFSEHDKSEGGSLSAKDSPTPMKPFENELDFPDMDMNNELMEDPWETCLFPSEPDPELYKTFEGFLNLLLYYLQQYHSYFCIFLFRI